MSKERAVLDTLVKDAGSPTDLAAFIGVSRATVYNWLAKGITPRGRFIVASKFPHTASKLFPKFD